MITIKVIILFWQMGSLCESSLSNESKEASTELLFEVTGYPLTGDVPLLNRKIFRGMRVTIREHPYIVSIRRNNCHYLTGTLITTNLVLTVAHPLLGVPVQELKIIAGENYSDRGTMLLTVILVLVHHDFDPTTLAGDLAMIRFYEDVIYKSSIKSIPLISSNLVISNSTAFVTGWGRCDLTAKKLCLPRSSLSFPDENMDPMLRTVSFKVASENFYCDGYKQHGTELSIGMLCAGPAREEKPSTACLAVPGAPLVVRAELAGIQSWGFGCGYLHDLPLVYTSIQHYNKWITHNTLVFRKISKEHVTQLFEATKSLIILEWLKKARVLKTEHQQHGTNYQELQLLEFDYELTKLQGDIFDIRDFVNNKGFRLKKKFMYKVIQAAQDQNETHMKDKLVLSQKMETRPFLTRNKTLLDTSIDYEDYDSSDDDD